MGGAKLYTPPLIFKAATDSEMVHCLHRKPTGSVLLDTMKLRQEIDDAKMSRKLIKPQIEKRRRERMNRSLDALRALLLQGQDKQGQIQRRMEKAEILEHTVLFFQNAADRDRNNAGGQQQHGFHDGFSACLQRAAQFLRPQEEACRLSSTLEATFAGRLACSDSVGVKATATACHSVLRPKSSQTPSTPLMMAKPSQTAQASRSTSVPLSNRVQPQDKCVRQTQRPNHSEVRVQRPATTERQCLNLPTSQYVWRPWP